MTCTARSRCRWSTRRWAPRSPSTPSWTAAPRSPSRPAPSRVRSPRCAATACRTCARGPGQPARPHRGGGAHQARRALQGTAGRTQDPRPRRGGRSSPPTPPRPATAAACSAGCGNLQRSLTHLGRHAVLRRGHPDGRRGGRGRRGRGGSTPPPCAGSGRESGWCCPTAGVRADCIVEAADKRRISAKVLDRQTVPRRRRRSPWCRPSPKPSAPSWRSSWPPRPGPTGSWLAGRALWPAGTANGGQGCAGGGRWPLGGPPIAARLHPRGQWTDHHGRPDPARGRTGRRWCGGLGAA